MNKKITKITVALLATVISVIIPFLVTSRTTFAQPPYIDATPVPDDLKNPKFLKNPCEKQTNNLLKDGAMGPDASDTQFGTVANEWTPFVYSGTAPQFRVVNNEGVDSISQQIFSSNAFDAGVMQTVYGTQPGAYYWFRLGWAPAGIGITNDPSPAIGVKVGVDPFGGTDPKSPNIIWSIGSFNDNKNLNRLQLILFFPASAQNVTIFLRGIATNNSGAENRVWLDAACMEARPDVAPATPVPPTATSTFTPTATRVAPSRAPATKAPATATNTPTRIVADIRAPDTETPTAVMLISAVLPTATARFARPDVTPEPVNTFDMGMGLVTGAGIFLTMGAFLFFGIGFVWWQKVR